VNVGGVFLKERVHDMRLGSDWPRRCRSKANVAREGLCWVRLPRRSAMADNKVDGTLLYYTSSLDVQITP
jgi:hypothetical protein